MADIGRTWADFFLDFAEVSLLSDIAAKDILHFGKQTPAQKSSLAAVPPCSVSLPPATFAGDGMGIVIQSVRRWANILLSSRKAGDNMCHALRLPPQAALIKGQMETGKLLSIISCSLFSVLSA